MTSAVFLAMTLACCIAALIRPPRLVEPRDFALLFAFGALSLGLGLSLFVTGARLIPAALAALVGTIEPALGPVWVWIVHGEIPSSRTLIGGSLVLLALLVHLAVEWPQQPSPAVPNEGSV